MGMKINDIGKWPKNARKRVEGRMPDSKFGFGNSKSGRSDEIILKQPVFEKLIYRFFVPLSADKFKFICYMVLTNTPQISLSSLLTG